MSAERARHHRHHRRLEGSARARSGGGQHVSAGKGDDRRRWDTTHAEPHGSSTEVTHRRMTSSELSLADVADEGDCAGIKELHIVMV